MKLLLWYLITICSPLTLEQFQKTYFQKDFFGNLMKVKNMKNQKLLLMSRQGFGLYDIHQQRFLYRISEQISNVQILGQYAYLLLENNKLLLKYDLNTGLVSDNINFPKSDFFLVSENDIFFINGNELIKQSIDGKETRIQMDSQIQFAYMNPETKNIFLILMNEQLSIYDFSLNQKSQVEFTCDYPKFEIFDLNQFIFTDLGIDNLCHNMQMKKNISIDTGRELEQNKVNEIKKNLTEPIDRIFETSDYYVIQSEYKSLFVMNKSYEIISQLENSLTEIKNMIFFEKHNKSENYENYQEYEQLLQQHKILQAWRKRLRISYNRIQGQIYQTWNNINLLFQMVLDQQWDHVLNFFNVIEDNSSYFVSVIQTDSQKLHYFNLTEKEFNSEGDKTIEPIILPQKDCEIKKQSNLTFSVTCSNSKFCYNLDFKQTDCLEEQNLSENIYGFDINDNNTITGYYKQTPIWNIKIPNEETFQRIVKIQDENIPDTAYIIEKNFVLYKLIDINNIAYLTRNNETYFLYIINLKSGKILQKYQINDIDSTQDIHLLGDDNSFFLTYFSLKTQKTEIQHIEIFRTKIEKDFLPLISDMWKGESKFLPEVNYNSEYPEFWIQERTYGLNLKIKNLMAFDSLNDLTSKDIIIITTTNQILSLSRKLLSTRRCSKEEKERAEKNLKRTNEKKIRQENYFKSQLLPDYEYDFEIDPKKYISRNLKLHNVKGIFIQPSHYESTSHVIISGDSFFHVLHSPDQKFDKLPDNFDKFKLILLSIAIVIIYIVTSKMAKSKAKYQKFSTN